MRNARYRGSALVEAALALAVLTPVCAWGLLFVDAWHKLENLEQAAIHGARFGSGLEFSADDPAPFHRAVQDEVVKTSPAPGLTRNHVRVTVEFTEDGRPYTVRVAIHGYRLRTPGASYSLDGKPSAAYPFRGKFSAGRRPPLRP